MEKTADVYVYFHVELKQRLRRATSRGTSIFASNFERFKLDGFVGRTMIDTLTVRFLGVLCATRETYRLSHMAGCMLTYKITISHYREQGLNSRGTLVHIHFTHIKKSVIVSCVWLGVCCTVSQTRRRNKFSRAAVSPRIALLPLCTLLTSVQVCGILVVVGAG